MGYTYCVTIELITEHSNYQALSETAGFLLHVRGEFWEHIVFPTTKKGLMKTMNPYS